MARLSKPLVLAEVAVGGFLGAAEDGVLAVHHEGTVLVLREEGIDQLGLPVPAAGRLDGIRDVLWDCSAVGQLAVLAGLDHVPALVACLGCLRRLLPLGGFFRQGLGTLLRRLVLVLLLFRTRALGFGLGLALCFLALAVVVAFALAFPLALPLG